MLPKNKLIRKLNFELKATQEHLNEKLDCFKHKDHIGRAFHHGEIIKQDHINTMYQEIGYITECISMAEALPIASTHKDCEKIWKAYLSY